MALVNRGCLKSIASFFFKLSAHRFFKRAGSRTIQVSHCSRNEQWSAHSTPERKTKLQDPRDSAADFTLDEVDELWSAVTDGKNDPTLTFETGRQNPSLPDAIIPRRVLTKTQILNEIDHDEGESGQSAHEADSEYKIDGILGEGGMGIIFDAKQLSLDRSVAIKMLKPTANQESQRRKFLSEAILTGLLQHPNIIALHDLAVDQDDHLFYSMKKINGEAWSQSIDTMSLDDNLEVFLRICNAVAFAHSRHVIHRDIKPGNIMLGEFGEVLLMDWGLAVVMPEGRPLREDEFPGLGGTPSYMSPELAKGDFEKLGPQSDIYLLGAILFQIITGMPPHAGTTVAEVVLNAANNVIEPTSKQGELLAIAYKAMASKTEDRFRSAIELRRTIRDFQTHSQSMGLTRRAKKMAKRAKQTVDYALFANAILTFQEAIDIWSENRKAINGLILTKKFYTEAAIENGDLDLAASILEGSEAINDNAERQNRTLTEKVSQLKKVRAREQRKQDRAQEDVRKWTNAFEASPDLVAISRLRDGLIFAVNQSYLRTLEYSRDEVIGKNSAALNIWVEPEQREHFVSILEKKGRCDEMEALIRTKSGKQIPVLMSACKLGFDGETAVITNAHDISSRKIMESRLAESEQRLRETQELAKLGTWEYDLETEKITWSDETFKIIGVSSESGEPSLEGFLSTVHPDDQTLLLTLVNKAREEGSPYRVEVRHKQSDGRYRHVLATGKPKFRDNQVVAVFGSVMDISEFRRSGN